jgi:hypothetical protein
MSNHLVSQMLKAVSKDIEAKALTQEGKSSGMLEKKKRKRTKHREGVRQSAFLGE